MLIKLSGRGLKPLSEVSSRPFVGRVTRDSSLPLHQRATEILLTERATQLPSGFRAYLFRDKLAVVVGAHDAYLLSKEFDYLDVGDVIRIEPAHGSVHAIYRRNSPSNSFLVTERCDNYCVMCSQPPKDRDDSWLVDELLEVIPLVSPDTRELGFTGGEPSLLGERLLELLTSCKRHLPSTAIHMLSNGRTFADARFAKSIASVGHHDLMVGIPLYADVPEAHDFIVQARGAFDETVRGILNLKQHGVRVELRFVIHAETFAGLPAFARFVSRNLLFVDHVALMGLELMGFARSNFDALWIDPLDYQPQLREAVEILDRAGATVSIYNHQLCTLDENLHRFAHASISDWKNAYEPECNDCSLRVDCGGFFASSELKRSRGIKPMQRSPLPHG